MGKHTKQGTISFSMTVNGDLKDRINAESSKEGIKTQEVVRRALMVYYGLSDGEEYPVNRER